MFHLPGAASRRAQPRGSCMVMEMVPLPDCSEASCVAANAFVQAFVAQQVPAAEHVTTVCNTADGSRTNCIGKFLEHPVAQGALPAGTTADSLCEQYGAGVVLSLSRIPRETEVAGGVGDT